MEKDINCDNRTEKRKIGDGAEDMAAYYLEKHGYEIVDRNFSCKTGEIDIIARLAPESGSHMPATLAFVEVKSRNSTEYGLPCQAVDYKKRQRIIRTAQFFLLRYPFLKNMQPSFDIVEILRLNGEVYIRHLKNAF
ncbi:MAG: YraN family protein [Clostridia bacterium]|nr:YraN family protein [Clostridia bacterium]